MAKSHFVLGSGRASGGTNRRRVGGAPPSLLVWVTLLTFLCSLNSCTSTTSGDHLEDVLDSSSGQPDVDVLDSVLDSAENDDSPTVPNDAGVSADEIVVFLDTSDVDVLQHHDAPMGDVGDNADRDADSAVGLDVEIALDVVELDIGKHADSGIPDSSGDGIQDVEADTGTPDIVDVPQSDLVEPDAVGDTAAPTCSDADEAPDALAMPPEPGCPSVETILGTSRLLDPCDAVVLTPEDEQALFPSAVSCAAAPVIEQPQLLQHYDSGDEFQYCTLYPDTSDTICSFVSSLGIEGVAVNPSSGNIVAVATSIGNEVAINEEYSPKKRVHVIQFDSQLGVLLDSVVSDLSQHTYALDIEAEDFESIRILTREQIPGLAPGGKTFFVQDGTGEPLLFDEAQPLVLPESGYPPGSSFPVLHGGHVLFSGGVPGDFPDDMSPCIDKGALLIDSNLTPKFDYWTSDGSALPDSKSPGWRAHFLPLSSCGFALAHVTQWTVSPGWKYGLPEEGSLMGVEVIYLDGCGVPFGRSALIHGTPLLNHSDVNYAEAFGDDVVFTSRVGGGPIGGPIVYGEPTVVTRFGPAGQIKWTTVLNSPFAPNSQTVYDMVETPSGLLVVGIANSLLGNEIYVLDAGGCTVAVYLLDESLTGPGIIKAGAREILLMPDGSFTTRSHRGVSVLRLPAVDNYVGP